MSVQRSLQGLVLGQVMPLVLVSTPARAGRRAAARVDGRLIEDSSCPTSVRL